MPGRPSGAAKKQREFKDAAGGARGLATRVGVFRRCGDVGHGDPLHGPGAGLNVYSANVARRLPLLSRAGSTLTKRREFPVLPRVRKEAAPRHFHKHLQPRRAPRPGFCFSLRLDEEAGSAGWRDW